MPTGSRLVPGSIGDTIVRETGASFNKAWDGLWTGKARIHDRGWDAEIAIPFKTLGFRKGQDTWGIKFIRRLMRKEESGYWPEANLDSHSFSLRRLADRRRGDKPGSGTGPGALWF